MTAISSLFIHSKTHLLAIPAVLPLDDDAHQLLVDLTHPVALLVLLHIVPREVNAASVHLGRDSTTQEQCENSTGKDERDRPPKHSMSTRQGTKYA